MCVASKCPYWYLQNVLYNDCVRANKKHTNTYIHKNRYATDGSSQCGHNSANANLQVPGIDGARVYPNVAIKSN